MNIVAATQQFAVREHSVFHSGRLEQTSYQSPVTQSSDNKTANSIPNSIPFAHDSVAPPAVTEQLLSAEVTAESTASDTQNEDKQRFNALQTVGAVKRILDQLSTGKLLSWIEGSSLEKIQAQLTNQQIASAPSTAAVAAPLTATSTTVTEWSYRYQELNADFSGELNLADGSSFTWSFELAVQEAQFSFRTFTEQQLQDPLILSLSGNAVQLKNQGTAFDFYGNGDKYKLPELAADQFYLMRDLNNNQRLDSGLELFGPATGHGFKELAALDDNQNGFIEASDSQWQSLNLWSQQDGLKSLQQSGIAAISAQSVATSFGLYNGDALLGRISRSGIFLSELDSLASYKVGLVQQVDLNI